MSESDRGPTADALRDDLRRVAAREDTSDPPTDPDYEAHGEWSAPTAVRHLTDGDGSWADALDAAGLDGDAARERRAPVGDPDAVRADLRRVAARADTSDAPTVADYEAHGEWSAPTVVHHLPDGDGSWADALDAAGLDGDAARERTPAPTPRDALCEDLRRVAAREDTADPPTQADYVEHGAWSAETVARRLSDGDGRSWAVALDAAGLDGDAARTRQYGGPDPDALRRDFRRVAAREDTADPPTRAEYDRHGEWAASTVRRRLGGAGQSWADVLHDAGVVESPSAVALRADVRRVAASPTTGTPPTWDEYCRTSRCPPSVVADRFPSWAAALDAAGVGPDGTLGRPDEARSMPLLADLRRVADREDTPDRPAPEEYAERGHYPADAFRDRFESWDRALALAHPEDGRGAGGGGD